METKSYETARDEFAIGLVRKNQLANPGDISPREIIQFGNDMSDFGKSFTEQKPCCCPACGTEWELEAPQRAHSLMLKDMVELRYFLEACKTEVMYLSLFHPTFGSVGKAKVAIISTMEAALKKIEDLEPMNERERRTIARDALTALKDFREQNEEA